ncbi:hypothetical protein LPN04_16040 [Rugamonas sp. A1-17]|nr:hypothetical protein [Rugamonas sp. A1-17]
MHMLRAVTSMANSGGGDVIYGMSAVEGVPVEVRGLSLGESEDEAQLRLENCVRDGVQPRLQDIGFRWVPVVNGRAALVIRVKNSWSAPHRVIVENHNHFYGRNSVGAYQMDVGELRAAFLISDSIGQQARQFITDRLMRVEAKSTPVPLVNGGKMVLHFIPVSAFSTHSGIRLSATKELASNLTMISGPGHCLNVNLEGAVQFESRSEPSNQYAQIFRNGCLEVACALQGPDGSVRIYGEWTVKNVIQAVQRNLRFLSGLEVGMPIVIALSFVSISGYALDAERRVADLASHQHALILPDVLVEGADADVKALMKPLFDILWNAFGFEECGVI